jgi:hypothetical protein
MIVAAVAGRGNRSAGSRVARVRVVRFRNLLIISSLDWWVRGLPAHLTFVVAGTGKKVAHEYL